MANPPESPTTLGRSGTLSWQQRRRPRSQIAVENSSRPTSPTKTVPESSTQTENEPTREQIAQSLGSRDPAWFKQTADRGIGSAAYRKTQELPEEQSIPGAQGGGFRLAGLGKETPVPTEPVMSPPLESGRSISPSRTDSIRGGEWSNRHSFATSATDMGMASTRASSIYDTPKLTPTTDTSPAHYGSGRISPTKGLGGFVQSAMLKRSDSMSKRWSATNLTRQGSTASTRGSYMGKVESSTPSQVHARPSSLGRGNSLEPSSRPSSSHSNQTITQTVDEDKDSVGRSTPSFHNRSKSMVSLKNTIDTSDDKISEFTSPPSPSKRWSPTKSSWLESKITKTDEKPKPTPPPPSQPSWMADLAKAKQQRNNGIIDESPKLSAKLSENKPLSPQTPSPLPPPTLKPSISAPEPSPKPTNIVSSKDSERLVPLKKSPAVDSAVVSPKPTPTKPAVAGKFDFRANLKPRAQINDGSKGEDLEFRNALGKLKRAQTDKYVAPDTLKDNILRGKTGLAQTGGPAKRERVDELKESLLKQKEAMKTKAATEPKRPQKPKGLGSTPEALAARNALNRTVSPISSSPNRDTSAEALLKAKELREKARPPIAAKLNSPPAKPSTTRDVPTVKATASIENPTQASPRPLPAVSDKAPVVQGNVSGKLMGRLNPALAGMLARGPPPVSAAKDDKIIESATVDTTDSSRKTPELTHMTKGRARGPKRRAPKTAAATEGVEEIAPKLSARETVQPKQDPNPPRVSETPKGDKGSSTAVVGRKIEATIRSRPLPTTPKPATPAAAVALPTPAKSTDEDQTPKLQKDKPPTPTKSSTLTRKTEEKNPVLAPVKVSVVPSTTTINSASYQTTPKKATGFETPNRSQTSVPKPLEITISRPDSRPSSPTKSPGRPLSVSVKDAAAKWTHQDDPPVSISPVRARSPVKLPTRLDEQKAMEDAGLVKPPPSPPKSAKPLPNLGLGLYNIGSQTTTSEVKQSDMNKRLPMSPPSSAGLVVRDRQSPDVPPKNLPTPVSATKSPTPKSSLSSPDINRAGTRPPSISIKIQPSESPIPQTSEAARMFSDFFDNQPYIASEPEIDVLQMLEADPLKEERVETIRKEVHEVTSGGKLTLLPSHQEHILFEDSMYVCVHTFQAGKAKTTEVFLWSGLGTSAASVEDAQIFARKVARENGANLILVRQGKETPIFFQALGGILITFRGSRSKSTSTGLPEEFVLCGRRHLGHISFDEVDFSVSSFCSGFPYLVFSGSSKLYLWRGEGSTADEVGCARLIAMDLDPTAEIIEIADGREPTPFLSLFPSPTKSSRIPHMPSSASHWRLKPTVGPKYRTRLFRVQQRTARKYSAAAATAFQVSSLLGGWATSLKLQALPSSPTSPSFLKTNTEIPKKTYVLNSAVETPRSAGAAVECTVEEVVPFAREDLLDEGVYVLDAFFEMYM